VTLEEREIILRAIHLGSPPRIGLRYAFNFDRSDIVDCHYSELGKGDRSPEEDEWGCVWSKLGGRIESSFGQVVKHPLETWREYDPPPDPDDPRRFSGFRALDSYEHKYKAGGFAFPLFNRLMFLRGIRNLMRDFYTNRHELERLADRILAFDRGIIRAYGDIGLDGVWFGDDLGSQKNLMFSPEIWREFFLPRYAKLFRWTHVAGMDVIFHTCGQTRIILQDLLNIGADALNLNQPELLGLDWLGRSFGGKTCFFCPVDTQRIDSMPLEDVQEKATALVRTLSSNKGGFVALCDEGKDHATTARSRIDAMAEAFEGFRRGV